MRSPAGMRHKSMLVCPHHILVWSFSFQVQSLSRIIVESLDRKIPDKSKPHLEFVSEGTAIGFLYMHHNPATLASEIGFQWDLQQERCRTCGIRSNRIAELYPYGKK